MNRDKRYCDDSRCSWQFHEDLDGWVQYGSSGARVDFVAAWMGDPTEYCGHLQFWEVSDEAECVDMWGDMIELPPAIKS